MCDTYGSQAVRYLALSIAGLSGSVLAHMSVILYTSSRGRPDKFGTFLPRLRDRCISPTHNSPMLIKAEPKDGNQSLDQSVRVDSSPPRSMNVASPKFWVLPSLSHIPIPCSVHTERDELYVAVDHMRVWANAHLHHKHCGTGDMWDCSLGRRGS
ncbi:hypothetical protein C8Q80DRAFT_1196633 [Daedaleopsis nitida]|nr:hypothetical protein C8Q80DRAFT_1196633 [Daedaleopsis nitida]